MLIKEKDHLENEDSTPPEIKTEVEFLASCSIDKLTEKLNIYYPKDWDGSHPNLKHYIPLLNRIDIILENHIKKYGLDCHNIAPIDVPYEEVQIIVTCVNYSNQLLEYSTNREIYNSHGYVADLIFSNSLDIKISAMKLLCCLSEKFATHFPVKFTLPKRHRDILVDFIKVFPPQSVRTTPGPTPIEINNFDHHISSRSSSVVPETYLDHTSKLNTKQKKTKKDSDVVHISLHDCMRPEFVTPSSWKCLNYEYYKTGTVHSNLVSKDSKKRKLKKDLSGEGLRTFTLSSDSLKKLSMQQIFDKAASVIPKEKWSDFVLHVYTAISYSGKSFDCLALRGKLVSFKCITIALAACNITYSTFVGLVFDEEPYLLSYLCDLVNPDNHIPREPCIAALRAFVNISSKKNGASDLMRAMGGNVSHGLLFHILKTILKHTKDNKFSNDQIYMNYLYNILANFLENKSLATHLRSAGLMKIFLEFLSLRNNYRMTRSGPLHLIEIFTEVLPEALDEFVLHDGFNVIISLLQFEVDFAIDNPGYEGGAPKNSNLSHIITARQVKLLNFLLKLIISLITNYPGDRMRNLYDSPMLGSINKIFLNPKLFGYELLFNSVRIITTVINNEPTAYSILKEAAVIDTFLDNFESFLLPDCDLILELPDAINAISLNNGGLASVKEKLIIPKLFSIFSHIDICKQLVVVENVMSLGHAIDELARHHPALKDVVHEQILKLINEIPSQVHFEALDFYQSENGALYRSRMDPEIHVESGRMPLERWETSSEASIVQCALIFIASIFENSKEWKRLFGQIDMNNLFKFVTLENAPFDYSLSKTIIHFRNIIKWIDQTTRSYCLPYLIDKIKETLSKIKEFVEYPIASESYFAQFDGTCDSTLQAKARETLSNLGIMNSLLFVLSDFYSKLHKYQPNKVWDIAEAFASQSGLQLIRDLCRFYRRLAIEEVLLHTTTPSKVACNAFTLVQSISIKQKEIGMPPPENANWNGTSAKFKNISVLYFNFSRSKFWLRNIFNSFCSINSKRSENKFLYGAATKYAIAIITEYTNNMMDILKDINTESKELRCGYIFCILNQLYLNLFNSLAASAAVNPTMSICLLQNKNFPYLKDLIVELFKILETCDSKEIKAFAEKSYVTIEIPSIVLAALSQLLNIFSDIGSVNAMNSVSNGDKLYAYLGDASSDYVAESLVSVQVQSAVACFVVLDEILSEDGCNLLNTIPEKLTENIVEGIVSISKAAFTNFKPHPLKFKGRLYPISAETTTPSDFNVKFLCEAGASEEEAKEILVFFNDNVEVLLDESVESLTENFDLPSIDWSSILSATYVRPTIKPIHLNFSPKYDIDTIDDLNFNISTKEQRFISQWILLAQLFPESVLSISNLVVSVFGKSFSENMNEVLDPLFEAVGSLNFESDDVVQGKKLFATLSLIAQIFAKLSFSKYFSNIQHLVSILLPHMTLSNVQKLWFPSAIMNFNRIFVGTKAPYAPSTPKVEVASKFPPYLISPPDINVLDSSVESTLYDTLLQIDEFSDEKLLCEVATLIMLLCDTNEKASFLSESKVIKAFVLYVKNQKSTSNVHKQVIQVLRRSIESDEIIKVYLEKEICNLLTYKRASTNDKSQPKKLKVRDLKSFLEDNAALVFRKPQLLAEVIGERCIIKPLNKHYKAPLISLLSDNDKKILQEHGISIEDRLAHPAQSSASIMNFLLSELMNISRKDMMSGIPTDLDMEPKQKDQISEEVINNNRLLAYTIFLLQTISELLFSYTSCKSEFLTFSKKAKDQTNKKPRSTALNMLIHKFITINSLERESDAIHRVHELLVSLGQACVLGLVSTVPINGIDYDSVNETHIDFTFIRKFTVDILVKILKETESSKKTSVIKYARIVDLLSLVRKLCGEEISTLVSINVDDDITANDGYHFTKELLDKKFVNVVSGIMARLDMNFPYMEQVVSAVLKLYSLLGEIKVTYQDALKVNNETIDDEELYDEEIDEKDEEEPDILRNSTLGMYDLDDVEDEDDFDDEFDDELLDDGIEIILSDHGDGGSDVEIIDELNGDSEVEEVNTDNVHDDEASDSDVIITDGDRENDFSRHLRDNQIDFVYESSEDVSDMSEDDEMIDSHEIQDYVSGGEDMSEDDGYLINGSSGSETDGDEEDGDIIELDLESIDDEDVDGHSDSDDSAILQEWLDEYESGEMNDHMQLQSRRDSSAARNHQHVASRLVFPPTESGIPLPMEVDINDNSRSSFMEFTQALLDRRTNANISPSLLDFRRMLEPLKSYRNQSFCTIKSTTQRWQDIAELYVGTNVLYRVIPDIIRRVYEKSNIITEEQKRIMEEKEARKRREREEEEEEKRKQKAKEEEEQRQREQIEEHATENSENNGESSEPVFVEIGGRQVDISGTGIDQEFLLALPDDMRQEVYDQHIQQSRIEEGGRDAIDFLRNLNLRSGFIPDTELSRVVRIPTRAFEDDSVDEESDENGDDIDDDNDEDDDNDSGADSLDLEDLDELDGNSINVRSFLDRHANYGLEMQRGNNVSTAVDSVSPAAKSYKSYFVPLVDRTGIAALLKLLFVPQVYYKRELFFKTVAYLCLSKHTRAELVAMVLYILQEGIKDQNSIASVYSQICGKALCFNKDSESSTIIEEFVCPAHCTTITLATQCIDVIQYLLENESSMRFHFVTEQDALSFMKRSSKKNKLKDSSYKFPINLLLNLLENRVIKEDTNLMDILSRSIQIATRPLPTMKAKLDELDKEEAEHNKKLPQLPVVPDRSLKQIINILVANECANKVFHQTIISIQNLSVLDNARVVFPRELSKKATQLSSKIVKELKELIVELKNTNKDVEDLPALSEFSSGASDQAKLLRVLTALDYLYQSVDNESDDIEELKTLYRNSSLGSLWGALSNCLNLLKEDDKMNYIAFILSPLIEALMVVCKHSKVQKMNTLEILEYEEGRELDFTNEPIESLFFTFTEEHKKILNHMIRNNSKLMSGPFALLIRNPRVLEFDNKRVYFEYKLHDDTLTDKKDKISINVRRDQVFLDSYRNIFFKPVDKIKKNTLEIKFNGEEGVDAGGVTREWYQVLSRQIFDPNYALFVPVASDKTTFHPNRTSWVNPEHLSFFKFVGMIIGKAIYDGYFLDCHFSRAVFKRLLGKPVSLKDMESLDLDYYKSLVWMLENDITDIIVETFSVETDDYGEHKIIDLIPNGHNVAVTEENKQEYVRLIVEYRLLTSVKDQMDNFLEGFYSMIPKDLISIFDEQELELLVSGLPDIDVDDWKNNTIYENYSASSPQVQWFWRAVKSFDAEERAKLLQFSTGTSKVPLNGFKELNGMNGIAKFSIHRVYNSTDRLPTAHTCFNQIDLPEYESYTKLRNALLLAIREGYEGFGFA
ncbi:hypothetical protein CANINC_000948 [Pichia inconspicua]|uniref:HECT-type E3 ubiquitin transferase n=1 Tax=Pichia inconspicua TaxID=52247 RepID=A0A4T0X5Y6_9ASCO|nr:hypothetical protein CANINC_000948 [[Candida] inconspicua]